MSAGGNIRAGGAVVELLLRDRGFRRGLNRASRQLQSFGSATARLGAGPLAAGAAGLSAISAAALSFGRQADRIDAASQATGIAAETLSELGFAARRSKTSLDELVPAIQRMNRRLGRITAGQGTSTQTEAIEALGLTAERLRRMDPAERFFRLADAIATHGDASEAAGLAQRAFGTSIDALIPLMSRGADGIRELMGEGRRLGQTITGGDAAAGGALLDALGSFRDVLSDAAFEIGAAVAPAMERAASAAATVGAGINRAIRENRAAVVSFAQLSAAVAGTGAAIVAAGLAIKVLGFALGGIAALISPVSLCVAAIAGGLATLEATTGAVSGVISALGDRLRFLVPIAQETGRGIAEALAAGDVAAAADVLWAGVELAFVRGSNRILRFMDAFQTSVAQQISGVLQTVENAGLRVLEAAGEFAAANLGDGILGQFEETLSQIGGPLANLARFQRQRRARRGEAERELLGDQLRANEADRVRRLERAVERFEEALESGGSGSAARGPLAALADRIVAQAGRRFEIDARDGARRDAFGAPGSRAAGVAQRSIGGRLNPAERVADDVAQLRTDVEAIRRSSSGAGVFA